MGADIADSMASAVENSKVVVCGVSSRYANSPNCRMEADYANKVLKGGNMVWLVMEDGFRPSGWLALYMGQKLYYEVTDDTKVHQQIPKIVQQ
eukprot:gene12842-15176_t